MPQHDDSCDCRTCVENFELYRISKLNCSSQSNIKIYTCFTCRDQFRSAHELYAHEQEVHTKEILRQAASAKGGPLFPSGNSKGSALLTPSPKHSLKSPTWCEEFTGNARARLDSPNEIYECDKCFRAFRKLSLLEDHYSVCPRRTSWADTDTDTEKPLAAPTQSHRRTQSVQSVPTYTLGERWPKSETKTSQDKLQTPTSNSRHKLIAQRKASKTQRYKCSYCSKILLHHGSLLLHEASHCKGGKACWGCKTWFPLQSDYDQHICLRHTRITVTPQTETTEDQLEAPQEPSEADEVQDSTSENVDQAGSSQSERRPLKINYGSSGKHRRFSKSKKPFQCWYCEKRFSKAYNRNLHHYSHQDEKLLVCGYCEVRFKTHWELYNHLESQDHLIRFKAAKKQGLDLFIGNTKTGVRSKARGHGITDDVGQPDDIKTVKTENIDETEAEFQDAEPEDLDNDFETAMLEAILPDQKCIKTELPSPQSHKGKAFTERQRKNLDKDYHQQQDVKVQPVKEEVQTRRLGPKTYQCSYCPKVLCYSRNLRVHEASHIEGQKACWECKRVFYSESEYRRHGCTRHRPWQKAARKSLANPSYNRQKSNTTVAIKCNIKIENGPDISPKVSHVQKEQPIKTSSTRKSKRYPCSHCSKTFSNVSNKCRHEYQHKAAKLFVCGYCDMSFQTSMSLYGHLKKKDHRLKFESGMRQGVDLFIGNLTTGRPIIPYR